MAGASNAAPVKAFAPEASRAAIVPASSAPLGMNEKFPPEVLSQPAAAIRTNRSRIPSRGSPWVGGG